MSNVIPQLSSEELKAKVRENQAARNETLAILYYESGARKEMMVDINQLACRLRREENEVIRALKMLVTIGLASMTNERNWHITPEGIRVAEDLILRSDTNMTWA